MKNKYISKIYGYISEIIKDDDWTFGITIFFLLATASAFIVECLMKPLFTFAIVFTFTGLGFILLWTNHGTLALGSALVAVSLMALCVFLNIAEKAVFRERKPFL